MKVMLLSFDRSLFGNPNSSFAGNNQERMVEYGKHLKKLFIIVHSLKHLNNKTTGLSDSVIVIPTNGTNRLLSFWNMFKISIDICKKEMIDIIHVQDSVFTGIVGYSINTLKGCRFSIGIYGSNPFDINWLKESWKHRIAGPIGRLLLKKADFIQVDGLKTFEDLIRRNFDSKKILLKAIVPVGIDLFAKGNGTEIRKRYMGCSFEKLMLFVGRLEKQKNLINFLKVFSEIIKKYPKLFFLIIGSGREKKHIITTIRKLKIGRNIKIIDNVLYTEMPDFFAACDVFVLPSNYEGFAKVLMEAAMAGKPIVTTNVSGVSDIVEDGISGFISDIGNMDKLKEYILNVIENKDIAKYLGENVKKNFISKFDTNKMINKQINFWKTLCEDD